MDCIKALDFNYPLNKRDKLFDRKFQLADSLDKKQKTLSEINELFETKIFTDTQLKSKPSIESLSNFVCKMFHF